MTTWPVYNKLWIAVWNQNSYNRRYTNIRKSNLYKLDTCTWKEGILHSCRWEKWKLESFLKLVPTTFIYFIKRKYLTNYKKMLFYQKSSYFPHTYFSPCWELLNPLENPIEKKSSSLRRHWVFKQELRNKWFNIFRSKEIMAPNHGQFIKFFYTRKILMKKPHRDCAAETSSRPPFNFGK